MVLQRDPDRLPGAGWALGVRWLADRVHWGPVVEALLPWDRDRTQVPPSVLLLTLLMNGLSQRTPLYHGEGWVQRLPWDLFWGEDIPTSVVNDDALGRVLEKLAAPGSAVVGPVGVRMQALAPEGPQILHSETTSFSLFGDYAGSGPEGDAPHMTYGDSKAHRPDLKPILRGLTTDPHGQVLWGDLLDGHTSAKAWVPPWRETLAREVPATAWKQAL